MIYRYEGAVHSKQGYFTLFFAGALTTIDALAAIKRLYRYFVLIRSGEQEFSLRTAWRSIILNKSNELDLSGVKGYEHEYTGLVHSEPEEMEIHELKAVTEDDNNFIPPTPTTAGSTSNDQRWADVQAQAIAMRQSRHHNTPEWRHSVASDGTLFQPPPSPRGSHHSDETLHEMIDARPKPKASLRHRIGCGLFATAERVLVFIGYMNVLVGIVTYTGGCRDSYVNGCLAHLISTSSFL